MKTRIIIALISVLISSVFAQNDEVLATFNGKDVTVNDFLIELNFLNQDQVQSVLQNPEAKQQVVETIIRRRLLLDKVQEEKLDTLPGTRILVNRQVEDALLQVMLNNIGQDAEPPTDKEVRDFYENNDSVFFAPKSVHIKRIVVEDEETGKIVTAALKGGIEFDSMIKKYPGFQQLPSGDIGYLPTDDLIPDLKSKLTSLKAGEYTEAMPINEVYQIFQVVEHRDAGKLPLEDVEAQIKNSLAQRKADQYIQQYQDQLWKDTDVKLESEKIKNLNLGRN